MAVRQVRSQEAQHDSGAILRSHGRDAVQFEMGGHVMTIGVERGIGGDVFYLPGILRWDDGEPLPTAVADLVRPVIEEVNAFWGSDTEFHRTAGE